MRDDNKKPEDERITVAQDGYPQSWSFGAFGSACRRTWWPHPGEAVPKLGQKEDT